MNKCKFCNTPICGDIPEDHEFILDEENEEGEDGKGEIGVVKENLYRININYCPLCGRKMKRLRDDV